MDDSKILIVGANGQLGTALREKYPNAGAVDSGRLDITDATAVMNYDWSDITTILNAAAYTNVDGAESEEGRLAAWKVNAAGVRNLAEAAVHHGLTLVHVSTDYVFDGTKDNHSENEPFTPLSVYGQSKAAGDIAASLVPNHYILRAAWVIGEGKNFVRTMLSLGERGIAPAVVSDQIGRLTFTGELVRIINHLLTTNAAWGTYNATNAGDPVSWADITRSIFKAAGYDLVVNDTSTAEYFAGKKNIAPRPLNSIMDLSKLAATGFQSKDWHADLEDYIKQELNA